MKKIQLKRPVLVFFLLIIAILIVFYIYSDVIISDYIMKNKFLNDVLSISDENQETIFSVQKVTYYSSASAIESSPTDPLKGVDIYQYTDITIQLDNLISSDDLNNINTVQQLYIDNIETETITGTNILNYKNNSDFGTLKLLEPAENNRIDFNIVNSNSENEIVDYSTPTFYTDCSNPITLGFINTDLANNYTPTDINLITYSGKILQEANIPLENLNTKIKFSINIINNQNEKFTYNVDLDVNLGPEDSGIYTGYVYRTMDTEGDEYNFIKGLI